MNGTPGLLWFDNDPKADLSTKVGRAAAYYKTKYGKDANLCFVHPTMLQGQSEKTAGIELRPSRSVMPNNFWIGGTNETKQ